MSKHIERVNITKSIAVGGQYVNLHRIRATRDFFVGSHAIAKGELGGWVDDIDCIEDGSWVADDAIVCDGSTLKVKSHVSGNSEVHSSHIVESTVENTSVVFESEVVKSTIDHAYVTRTNAKKSLIMPGADINDSVIEHSRINRGLFVTESTIKNARLCFHAHDACVEIQQHTFMVDPMGSELSRVTLHRTRNENGYSHTLRVGCWTGTVDELMDEVEQRREAEWRYLDAKEEDKDIMVEQYKALEVLLQTIMMGW